MTLSDQLRKAIRDYGSVNSVAKASGINQSALNRFYRGDRDLYLATVERLCEFFGMKLTKPTMTRRPRDDRRR
jgi:DNA-binding phage protein